jgi:hypothetical protein
MAGGETGGNGEGTSDTGQNGFGAKNDAAAENLGGGEDVFDSGLDTTNDGFSTFESLPEAGMPEAPAESSESFELGPELHEFSDHAAEPFEPTAQHDEAFEPPLDSGEATWRQEVRSFSETLSYDIHEAGDGSGGTSEPPETTDSAGTEETSEMPAAKDGGSKPPDVDAVAAEILRDNKNYIENPANEDGLNEVYTQRLRATAEANPIDRFENGPDGNELLESREKSDAEWEKMNPAERAEWEKNFWNRAERELKAFRNVSDAEYENLVWRKRPQDAMETEDFIQAQTEGNWAERSISGAKHWWGQQGGREKFEATFDRVGKGVIATYDSLVEGRNSNRDNDQAAQRQFEAQRQAEDQARAREQRQWESQRQAEDERQAAERRKEDERRSHGAGA